MSKKATKMVEGRIFGHLGMISFDCSSNIKMWVRDEFHIWVLLKDEREEKEELRRREGIQKNKIFCHISFKNNIKKKRHNVIVI